MKHNYFILVLLACIIQVTALAQPTIKHQRTIGGSYDDHFTSMYLTKDGGLIAGGWSFSNISSEKTENNRGMADYWVIKIDSLGKIQWDKTMGGSDQDLLRSLQQTSDGGYILGGSSPSNISGEKTQNSRGLEDYWVVKLDRTGNIQWDKTIGGNSNDELRSLQQTSDGGYILGGWSGSNISGEKTQNSRGLEDYWVVKLDRTGNIQWDKTIGGNDWDLLFSLQQTSDGGYILGGTSISNVSGEKTENSRGWSDYWMVKLDGSGSIQWDKTIGGSDIEEFSSLQQTTDEGYILGGSSFSNISGEKTQRSRGGIDYWVVRLDKSGAIIFDKTIGGSSDDLLSSLQQTSDGGYIVGGYSRSNISGEKTEDNKCGCSDYNDYWIVKLSAQGYIQGDKTIGGNADDALLSIREIEKYRYALGGYSNSDPSGDKTQRNRGPYYTNDYWLVELVYKNPGAFEVVSAQEVNIKNNKPFAIYPNPAKDILYIQTNRKASLSLTNQSGKVLLTKTINGNGTINVAALPAGLYYLKNTATSEVQKVIVIK